MSIASPQLIFKSSMFSVGDGEDASTNPDIYGRALAEWIGREFVAGFSPDDIIPEDFGWLVEVPNSQHSLYIACSSTDELAEEWRVMVFAEGGLISRILRKGNHAESVGETYAAIKRRVEGEDRITDIHEE